jgi:hypothetical protein
VSVVVMPDAVLLARGVLVADEAVSEAISERVVTVSPEDATTAWIRLHALGGARSLSAPLRLADRMIQVDCFAPATVPSGPLFQGDAGAMALALLAEAALFGSVGFSNSVGIIAYVREVQGPQSLPDTSRTPPTPRVLFTVSILVHPIP